MEKKLFVIRKPVEESFLGLGQLGRMETLTTLSYDRGRRKLAEPPRVMGGASPIFICNGEKEDALYNLLFFFLFF
uniref:Uncharacterized protein n=1 Tax=Rhizophora mucronata TaxID=61149 RepID=A0A2P2M4W3_RHIMU